MRLQVKNSIYKRKNDDYYSPIDLNHIFHDDNIVDEWARENDQPAFANNDLEWFDRAIEESEGDDNHGAASGSSHPNRRNNDASQRTRKGKNVISNDESDASDDSNSSGEGNNHQNDGSHQRSLGDSAGQMNEDSAPKNLNDQHNTGTSWTHGNENYYATQDTYHGGAQQVQSGHGYGSSNDSQGSSGLHSQPDRYSDHAKSRYPDQLSSTSIGAGYRGANYGSFGGSSKHRAYDYSSSGNTSGRFSQPQGCFEHQTSRDHLSSGSSAIGYYGHDHGSSGSTNSSIGYRGFGYYHHGDEPPSLAYPDAQFASSQLSYSHAGFSMQHDTNAQDVDDFIPPRPSTWY